jgi:hypothetical protein
VNEEALAYWGLTRQKKKNLHILFSLQEIPKKKLIFNKRIIAAVTEILQRTMQISFPPRTRPAMTTSIQTAKAGN